MSEDIPYATPYPWDNKSMEQSQKSGNRNLRKEVYVGSGFAALRKNALGPNSTLGSEAKNLLLAVLQRQNVKLGSIGSTANNNSNAEFDNTTQVDNLYGSAWAPLNKEANTPGTADDVVLQSARNGKFSIFASILKLIETEEHPPVPTKHIIRHCCLTIRPGDIPGSIDAKEMILASLSFLSSQFTPGGSTDQLLNFPLISAVQDTADLERRTYNKVGDWKLQDINDKLQKLEAIFIASSPKSAKWLRREAFCPFHLSTKEEITFCLKGVIPPSASAKRTKVGGEGGSSVGTTRKRKTPSSSTTTTTTAASTAATTTTAAPTAPPPPPPPTAATDPESSSGGPVVEATIVDDSPDHLVR